MFSRERLASIPLLGMLLSLPTLFLGWHTVDDPLHRQLILDRLAGRGGADPWFQLFSLIDGDPVLGASQRFELGRPWWADDALSIRFLRPVAALTHYIDYFLWPESPWAMHLQNVLWYGLACLCVALLCQRLSGDPRAGFVGALLYAIDDAHAETTAWIANRNALIATALAATALLLFVRGRVEHRRALSGLSALTLLFALLSAESAIGITAYFGAHALWLDRARLRERALALLPAAFVTVGWFAIHRAFDYGARRSGFYLDPVSDPRAFLDLLPIRMWALLHGEFVDLEGLFPWLPSSFVDALRLAGPWLLMPAVSLWLLRRLDRDRELGFWFTGALLSMLPLVGVPPNPRLLVISGIGWAMVLAILALRAFDLVRSGRGMPRALAAAVLTLLLAFHVVLSPVAFVARAATFGSTTADPALAAPSLDEQTGLPEAHLIVLNAPNQLHGALIPVERARRGLPVARYHSVLGATPHRVEITRIDARSFELSSPYGYLEDVFSAFWRSPSHPIPLDHPIRMQDHVATVRWSILDGRPQRVLFRFEAPLESEAYRFLVWRGSHYETFEFAPVGIHTSIPASYDPRGVKLFE